MTLPDYVWVFLFVALSYGFLHLIRAGLSQWLRWDTGERERLLQEKLRNLQDELSKTERKVDTLEKQIELLLQQYNDAIVRLSSIKKQYENAVESADSLKEELDRVRTHMPRDHSENRRKLLISAVGSDDDGLMLDIASLRAVRMETGLDFERILDATPEKLKASLDRARMSQTQTYLHLSVHSDKTGYLLGDTVIDPVWLSGLLDGVIVLVVAGCDSSWAGDFLGNVPYVVTMGENVPTRDAAHFTRAFWTEIGSGMGPTRALKQALLRSPSGMREIVVQHWA